MKYKNKNIKLCIIGGGPLGIGLGRELSEGNINYDLYEMESDLGGVWNSQASCGRVYPSLHLISPKFNTQVPDYPMPDNYPVYPNHSMMLDYLRSYAKKFDVYNHSIFNTEVINLEQYEDIWEVELSNGKKKKI
ncbi:NAD(P)-binding protein [Candidatus Profftella armatura]|uniref:NAD(P)-binding protein n=1 Tax=Candidatus Profftella armatura TaxID=669502 RepID=UPI003D96E20C